MVKRLLCLALCLLALSACSNGGDGGGQSLSVDAEVKSAVEAYNGEEAFCIAFAFDLKKQGDEESLVFTQGTISCRTDGALALSGRVTQVENGEGITYDVFYKAGAYYRSGKAGKFYMAMDGGDMLSSFFCTDVPVPGDGDVSAARTAQTDGVKYVYTAGGLPALSIVEASLYGYCGLRKPVREKTRCDEAEYSYVLDGDGALSSFKVSASATLFETAPYYPSYAVPESELTCGFQFSLDITVKARGGDVTVETPDTSEYVFLG